MKSLFESDELKESTNFMVEYAGRLTILFPQLEWDLKKAGYSIEPPEFLSLVIYLSVLLLCIGSTSLRSGTSVSRSGE